MGSIKLTTITSKRKCFKEEVQSVMLNYKSYIREQYQSLQEKVWKPNMGDLAEPILACGVAAKFANPDAVVTRTAIEKLLRKVIKKNPENIDVNSRVN